MTELPKVRRTLSLRTRLTLGTAVAIAVLVSAFAIATIVAIGVHLLSDVQISTRQVATAVAGPSSLAKNRIHEAADSVDDYTGKHDPRLWLMRPNGVVYRHSPNASAHPPDAGVHGLLWDVPAWRVALPLGGGWELWVDWPIEHDLDLMRALVLVLFLGGFVTAGVGALVGRWATRRVLDPVNRMTEAASAMLRGGASFALPPLPGEPDEFTRLAGVLTRLVRSLEERRLAERRFLAEAAHALRTPLAILSGNVHLLASWGAEDPAVRSDSLEAMGRALADADHLVADLLTLERAASARSRRPRPVELSSALREMAEDGQALAEGLAVSGPAAASPEVWAKVDPDQFRRAVWAVVENAVAYTPKGGEVKLDVQRVGQTAEVRVTDTGPGIKAEEADRVWDRFYRGEAAQGRPGSGLGLPMAKALTESEGGKIRHQPASAAGGTQIVISLPVVSPPAPS